MSLQLGKYVGSLDMLPIMAVQNVKRYSQGTLLQELIFLDSLPLNV